MPNSNINTAIPFQINIVCALPCEARALIDFYQLQKNNAIENFPVYLNKDKTIFLIVSGVGAIKSAAATSFLYAITSPKSYACFLNVGIAGSGMHQVGELMVVNKIQDDSRDKHYYPTTFYLPKYPQGGITTYLKPQKHYHDKMMDMEAAGFWQAATLCVTQEQVQVVKIIADNDLASQQKISADTVKKLCQNKIKDIDLIVQSLIKLSCAEQNHCVTKNDFSLLKGKYHFSQYQQYELKELLRRYHALQIPLPEFSQDYKAANILQSLSDNLQNQLMKVV